MRQLLYFLSFLYVGHSLAQDTVYSRIPESSFTDFSHEQFVLGFDCAHGHICCQVGCSCCTELSRPQYYDTVYHPAINGIQRITIVERYTFASSHERSPVHYRFKQANGELSPKWYLVEGGMNLLWGADGFDRYPKELEERYQRNNAILVMDAKGSFQRIDLQGNFLPMIYHSRRKTDQNTYLSMIIANGQRYYGFSDSSGALIGTFNFTKVFPFNDQGIAITVNAQHLHGLVTCAGKEVLAPTYYEIHEIGKDRFSVVSNGKFTIIDSDGDFKGKGGYIGIQNYSEGKAFAQKDQRTKEENNLTWACLDMEGNQLFTVKAEWVGEFHDGLAGVFRNKKWGFIDTTGKLVIEHRFDGIYFFDDGAAPVCIKNSSNREEWFLIDHKGNPITNKRYTELTAFKNGLARAHLQGQGKGMIDTKGKEVIPFTYLFEGYGTPKDWFIDGTLLVVTFGKDHSTVLLDKEGKVVLNLSQYRGANYVIKTFTGNTFLPYLMVYKDNTMRTLIDFTGKEILSREYRTLTVLNEQLAVGSIGSTNYLIDIKTDKHLLEFPDNNYYSFQDDLLMVQKKGYPQIIEYYDTQGKKVEVYGGFESY